MPAKGSRKCTHCDEFYDEYTFTFDGEVICYACEESAMQYMSHCIHIPAFNVPEIHVFSNDFGLRDKECWELVYDNESGKNLKYPKPIKLEKWVHTDAWRGYTDWEYHDGYMVIGNGWITGWADKYHMRKADLNDLMEQLLERAKNVQDVPVDIWVITGVTSNVFSTAMDFIIREKDEDKLRKYLNAIFETSPEDINDMLG